MFRSDLLSGKRILITGGGTGLGQSMGRRYLQLAEPQQAGLFLVATRARAVEVSK